MNKKIEKREKQTCYNCAHMEVKDLKRCPNYLGGNEWRDVHPTHWMPLPQALKKGE